MPSVIGNTIVILAVVALAALSLREILKSRKGGGCASCGGGCSSCSTGCSVSTADTGGALPRGKGAVRTVVKIDGMMCPMCEAHINETLRKLEGVKKVKSSHTKGEAVIYSENPVKEEEVAMAIAEKGYEFKGFA